MKLLSVVFSFRNEESNLIELVKRTSTAIKKLGNWTFELIFVNDDSNDSSETILTDLQKSYPIKIVNMSRRFGVGPCVLAGLNIAKGDAVVYMDSDLQDPPEIIPKLVQKFENGVDVVHTRRTKRLEESFVKIFLTKMAYRVINISSNIPLPVDAGDFKLLSRRAVSYVNNLNEHNPYIRGLTVWVGFKQDFVDYERQGRFSGESKFPSLLSARYWYGASAEFVRGITGYSTGPLLLGIFIGLFSILFSFILIIYALYTKFSGAAIPGSSGIIIVVAFFSGMILTTIGITGLYIARIYEQTQGRPRYIIKNVLENKIVNDK
tara:strand:- start:2198 stop:3160 length:963 start_codon:yes stop_codon:yes gene_type:complete